MSITPGDRLGTYVVDSEIGAGGMGCVFLAHDTRLQRRVAIKVLPHETADRQARYRFEKEAITVSALNHPHILTVHEAGVSGAVRIAHCSLDKDALGTPDSASCVRKCQAVLTARGLDTVTTSAAFATDAGPFSTAGLPGVVLGPGSIQQAHTVDEWIDLKEYEAACGLAVQLATMS